MTSLSADQKAELRSIAQKIVANGHGILAADESSGTMGKRLANINVANEEPNRLFYRNFMFQSEGIEKYIGGCILFHETLYQTCPTTGKKLPEILKEKGIVVGIKVDKGVVPIHGTDGETVTDKNFNIFFFRFKKELFFIKIRLAKVSMALWSDVLSTKKTAAISQNGDVC